MKSNSNKNNIKLLENDNLVNLLENNLSDLLIMNTKDLYPIYKQKFTNIDKDFFENAVKYVLFTNIPEIYKHYKDQVKEWVIKRNNEIIVKKEIKHVLNHDYYILNSNIYSKFNINGNQLDIIKIIKEYPIDINVPFMITRDKEIVIKFDKTFDSNTIKSWIKKYKNIKELNNCIKVKILSGNSYALLTIYTNGNFNIKYNFKKIDNINFDNLNKNIKIYLYTFLKNTSYILNKNITLQDDDQINIKYAITMFEINKYVLYKELEYKIRNEYPEFSINQKKIKNILTLKSNLTGNTIIINNLDKVNTRITLYGINTEYEILKYIKLFINIFSELKSTDFLKKNNKKNIKILREKGVSVSAVGCQKIRQPSLIKSELINSSNSIKSGKSIKSGNFKDLKSGIVFSCNNKKFPFVGFTNNNIICCFKKDQTKKLVYLRNTIPDYNDSQIFIEDSEILKKDFIVTDKLLEPNRLSTNTGFLIKNLVKVYSYRFGVVQNYNIPINLIEMVLKKRINIDKIIDLLKTNEFIYKSLDNGNLELKMTLDEYISFLISNKIKGINLFELLTIFTGIDILLIDQNCIKHIGKNINNKVILIKKTKNYYEPIFYINNKNIIRIFNKNDINYSFTNYEFDNIKVKLQFLNAFNKVSYIDTNYGIIPVYPKGLNINYPVTKDFNKLHLLNAKDQYNLISKLKFKIVSQIVDNNKTTGIVTDKDLIIPVKKSIPLDLPISFLLFVPEIDKLIKNKSSNINNKLSIINTYGLEIDVYKELYQRLRYTTSIILKESNLKLISKQIDSMINELKKILEPFILLGKEDMKLFTIPSKKIICSSSNSDLFCKENKLYIPKKYYNIFLKKMSFDILNKNVYGKQILNATIKNEYISNDSFIKRSREKILLVDSDIKKFLSKK